MNQYSSTSIVNLRHHNTAEVYCGRGSVYGNPFEIGRDGDRNDVCDKFEKYFHNKLLNTEFRANVMSLKGKRLGCWCKCSPPCNNPKCKPHRCHLETIINYIENEK
jgi:hypothetical protein